MSWITMDDIYAKHVKEFNDAVGNLCFMRIPPARIAEMLADHIDYLIKNLPTEDMAYATRAPPEEEEEK